MKNLRTVVMDEMGRIILPHEVRNILDVKAGDTLEVTPSQDTISVTLQRDASPGSVQLTLEQLHRLTFSKELRAKLGWTNVDCKDTISVSVNRWNRTLTLRLYEKYERKCDFCDKPEAIQKINRFGLCRDCAESINLEFKNRQGS